MIRPNGEPAVSVEPRQATRMRAPYDELLRERARRIEKTHTELLQLERNDNSVARRQ